jgi:hypothetical protein
MLKQGARPARSRSQTNKFFGQNREATTEGNLPVTTTVSEDYAFPAGHAARGRSASPRCSRRRTASGISPFWRRSCVRTPWAPWREPLGLARQRSSESGEDGSRPAAVALPAVGISTVSARTVGCRSRSSSAGPWWGEFLFGLGCVASG